MVTTDESEKLCLGSFAALCFLSVFGLVILKNLQVRFGAYNTLNLTGDHSLFWNGGVALISPFFLCYCCFKFHVLIYHNTPELLKSKFPVSCDKIGLQSMPAYFF